MEITNPTKTAAWQALLLHYETMRSVNLRDLFAADSQRFKRFSCCFDERLLLDYSKNLVTTETIEKLLALAEETHLTRAIHSLVNGDKINHTENRAVLHTALRNRANTPVLVDNQDVMPLVNAVLAKMRKFCAQVISGGWRGYSGLAITDVVNIGIGGSHLGPLMATQALTPYKNSLALHFISNIDGSEITEVLQKLTPATTMFLIASKTFTTKETMINAATARDWLLSATPSKATRALQMRQHFIALSANAKEVAAFGVEAANHFEYWSWVGGRFSLWSAAGLSIALAIGFDNFKQLLAGAHAMDRHFVDTPLKDNLPVILALLTIWYSNFFGAETEVVLPYGHHLQRLNAYLQQVNMESNGKSVDRNGVAVDYQTGPILWGEQGTNGQHAFYQLLHQGTHLTPCDFIAMIRPHHALAEHHTQLLANVFAQTQALAFGTTPTEVMRGCVHAAFNTDLSSSDTMPFRALKGNCPSNTLLLRKMTPYNLGLLLALYEHKIFSHGAMLNIFSFDQWGVEWGKQLAQNLNPVLINKAPSDHYDSSTNGLINYFKAWGNQLGT